MHVAVICVHYVPSRVRATLSSLKRFLRQFDEPEVVLVSNHPDAYTAIWDALDGSQDRLTVIQHDNSGLEFGAYQVGIDHVTRREAPAWLLLANDTFSLHQVFPLSYVNSTIDPMRRFVHHPVIVGQVEGLPRSYVMEGVRTHRWITTNLFAINQSALETLQTKVYEPRLDELIRESARADEFFSSQIDPVLRSHLESWLFATCGQNDAWYAARPLDIFSASVMAKKARSIIQEKRLSAILENASAEFINIKTQPLREILMLRIRQRARALL